MSDRHDVYAVQIFLTDGKGRLSPGSLIECRDADEARLLAEQRVRRGSAAGAAAFLRRDFCKEFDDGNEPITIAAFGKVPPEAQDVLPF